MSKKNAVKVVEKTPGPKIDWEQDGTRLIFNDELMVNAAKFQKDWPVHTDICADDSGNLMVGVGDYYVAQLDIPAREYIEVEDEPEATAAEPTEGEDTPAVEPESGSADASGMEGGNAAKTHLEPLPINMAEVVLTLWDTSNTPLNH